MGNLASQELSQTLWAKLFGDPGRIILDQGGPIMGGRGWADLVRIFGWQYIRAPVR